MSRTFRGTLLLGVLFAALATAGSAWASFAPKLSVKPATTPNAGVTISASVGQADDPTARVSIYVPAAYQVDTSAAPGTKLGTVTGTASAADLNGAVLQLQGELDVIAPNATAQAQCQVPTAAATWDMHLQAATTTLDIPMYVVKNAGPEATAGAYKLVVCLPPPDVPTTNPARAVFGAKLLSAVFTSSAITNPTTSGEFRWPSLWTPYIPTKGTPNAAGTVESQALVRSPAAVQIAGVTRKRVAKTTTIKVHGKKVKHTTVSTVIGYKVSVTEGGTGVTGAKVSARVGGKLVKTSTTSATGLAVGTFTLKTGTVSLAVTGVIPDRDLGAAGCVATEVFGAPCIDATVSGSTHAATLRVTAYKK
jgi:hypothetical protein